eukprot:CAMPEP_0194323830 /NCGR_PEP_ID=MMETSP0171-20130528/25991_1 /TAXON_ID=218684 /ORGANISM="Corethron pennatum, Strain L29A3" /LENGTH=141 /DNA_ID=CAMNT_0039082563 /DNA_START=39 /DNA_END=460 /DNA_ORIENTATION=+
MSLRVGGPLLRSLSAGHNIRINLLPLCHWRPTATSSGGVVHHFSDGGSGDKGPSWRKSQLERLESKFHADGDDDDGPPVIESDGDVQQMWREMEGRVTKRRLPPKLGSVEARGRPTGRRNVRKSEEDVWLEAGLYAREDGG